MPWFNRGVSFGLAPAEGAALGAAAFACLAATPVVAHSTLKTRAGRPCKGTCSELVATGGKAERWIESPVEGKGPDDYKYPAPGLKLLPAKATN